MVGSPSAYTGFYNAFFSDILVAVESLTCDFHSSLAILNEILFTDLPFSILARL